ncbi:hypothetical protein CI109_101674 [Kwoniella shandongensis]|uniref:Uncharacterized protein n=1 Tax=Kwoniella shandongensis TaxID=1734106 RepID=A0A5M6CBD9_9TREE|nr:uncharacterized protein CI109_001202 [Kwoniella shandongensis]KAA5530399.1 hypothetical protein CI109_001202 [Kwoniella shandongensis]
MSLRLPSQNKFKPVARPGVRKGPPVARPAPAPVASGIATSSTVAPKTSQPTAPPPSSSALQPPTPTSAPSQLPPSLGSAQPPSLSAKPVEPSPTPISSAQIQAIRDRQPQQSEPSIPGSSTTASTTSQPATSATAPEASPRAASVQPPVLASRASIPRSSPAPPGAKLSLLSAARAHTSAGPSRPSPGGITRRTPSVSSQSQALRASSVTPQHPRAPSVTPQPSARAPSVTPQPQTQPSYGAPPSLATSTAPSGFGFGLPPSLGVSTQASSSRPSTPPADASALAAAAVASIQPITDTGYAPVELGKPQKRNRKPRYAPKAKTTQEDGSSQAEGGTSQSTARKPARKKKAAPLEEREMSQGSENVDELAEEGEDQGKRKEPAEGTQEEHRPTKKSKPSKPKPVTVSQISLADVQPEEMVGDRVDEVIVTMGDLATILAAQGKVSKRAIKIDDFKRNEELKRRAAVQAKALETWRRKQIQRRKVRAAKNVERARRREELGKLGMDEGEVSPDEDDSEEEFEPVPDRLTPESTPEPQLRLDSEMPERDDDEDDDEPRTVNGDEQPADMGLDGSQAGDDFMGGNENDFAPPEEDDDEETAALRAAGFMVTGDKGGGVDEDGEGDNDDFDEYDDQQWLQGDEPDLEGYRYELEERRRRMMQNHEEDGEVVEVDDETRFVNSATWGKSLKPQRWTAEDTELFYLALEETGENYSLMAAYFPGRTNKQLKLKGLRENKLNPTRMTAAILSRKPLDKAYLSKSAGYNPDKPWDREEALFEEARQDQEKLRRVQSEGLEGKGRDEEDLHGLMAEAEIEEADEKSGDEEDDDGKEDEDEEV